MNTCYQRIPLCAVFLCALILPSLCFGIVGQEASIQVPGRIIVRVSPSLASDIERALPLDSLNVPASNGAGAAAEFIQKHSIKELRPLYESLVREKRVTGQTAEQIGNRVRARFNTRSQRHIGPSQLPDLSRTYMLTLAAGARTSFKDSLRELKNDANVEFAEPDKVVSVQFIPNDAYYTYMYNMAKTSCQAAWDLARGAGVIVAVIDTGLDYNHPDIVGNVWSNTQETAGNGIDDDGNHYIDDVRGWDFIGASYVASTQSNDPMDGFGHGTHVAGTIAAVGNNSNGVIGVAFSAHIMPLKALDNSGYGLDSALAQAIHYAADNGADVINNSWAGVGSSAAIDEALQYAYNLGVVIVSAAGNNSQNAANYYPAGSPYTLTVAAYDWADTRATFSNWGSKIDVAAPGVNILSLQAANTNIFQPYAPQYAMGSGTSMASPHVAGLAALILSAHPDYTQEQVRQTIRASADNVDHAETPDVSSGYGRMNAYKALSAGASESAKILSPKEETRLSTVDAVSIIGTASGPNFASYVLEYGYGDVPLNWLVLSQSATPAIGTVLGVFDPSHVVDGRYTLRLKVTDSSGAIYQDRTVVIVDKTAILDPAPPPQLDELKTYKAGAIIAVSGRALGSDLQSIQLEWIRGVNSAGTWSSAGVVNSPVIPTPNGPLGTWDTRVISQADYYTLHILAAHASGFTDESRTIVYIDPDLLNTNFPVLMPQNPIETLAPGVDASGQHFLFYTSPYNRFSVAADGSTTNVSPFPSLEWRGEAAVDGLDGSAGSKEIVYDGAGLRIIWPSNVSTVVTPNVPVDFTLLTTTPITVTDLAGDGGHEIIAAGKDSSQPTLVDIFAFRATGQQLTANFPISVPNLNQTLYLDRNRVLAVDLNGDHKKQLVVVSGDTSTSDSLRLYDSNGTRLPWGNPSFPDAAVGRMVAGDLYNDGKMEVVISYHQNSSSTGDCVAVYDSQGLLLPGWPVSIPGSGQWLALGDLNGDGKKEIVAAGSTSISVFNPDGSLVSGWPLRGGSFGPVTIGDINGDGRQEIVAVRSVWSASPFPLVPETDGGQGSLQTSLVNSAPLPSLSREKISLDDGSTAFRSVATTSLAGTIPYFDNSILVLDRTANLLKSWKLTGTPTQSLYGDSTWLAIGDLLGNGSVAVATNYITFTDLGNGFKYGYNGIVSVYTMGGTLNSSAMQWPTVYANPQNTFGLNASADIAPNVSLTSPADGATLEGVVSISAQASDAKGITGVQFMLDGAALGSVVPFGPYTITWNTNTVPNGTHVLTAVAQNSDGLATTSPAVTVSVKNDLPPSVAMTTPGDGATVFGTVTVSAAASDDKGVAGVQFQLDGINLGAELTSAPYTMSWNTARTTTGFHNLTAVARDIIYQHTTSAAVRVLVDGAPKITTQPSSQTVTSGSNVSFSVVASGMAPLTYQWKFNDKAINKATASSYTISSVQLANAGNYTVVVTNSEGSVTSAVAALTVQVPPSITTQPVSQTVAAGSTVAFSVAASGTAPLNYQWLFNNSAISGAISSSYSISPVQVPDAGKYSVVVSNAVGSVTSVTALLSVNVPPTITTQPLSQTVAAGSTATFNVVADGSSPLSYQWFFNGKSIGGATTASYKISSVKPSNAGNYTVVVSNTAGKVTSVPASLTVK